MADQTHGLHVRYYDNAQWNGEPVYVEIAENIEFDWTDEAKKPVSSPFGVILEGYIDIHISDTYTFRLTSDDGSWLFLDNVLIIDNGGYHPTKSATGSLTLEKGAHKIMIQYFDGGGGAALHLSWVPPGGVESEIPIERLSIQE